MSLSISWKNESKFWAAYKVQINGQSFEFDGTDLIDSITEVAEATISAVLENQNSEAAFENEPGQHILKFQPLGDGRVKLGIVWADDTYELFGDKKLKKLLEVMVGNQELLNAVLTFLQQVKRDCGNSPFTLQGCKFPQQAYEKLCKA